VVLALLDHYNLHKPADEDKTHERKTMVNSNFVNETGDMEGNT
jgi:hypothetical protein